MRHIFVSITALCCALAFGSALAAAPTVVRRLRLDAGHAERTAAAAYQRATWHWERVMGRSPTRPQAPLSPALRVVYWRRLARATQALAEHPPHLRDWLCIHRYEGSWRAVAPPYYGGLQMDLGFQRAYGAWLLRLKGTADHWTPLEQIWAAERALPTRSFTPWPNSARLCGLL